MMVGARENEEEPRGIQPPQRRKLHAQEAYTGHITERIWREAGQGSGRQREGGVVGVELGFQGVAQAVLEISQGLRRSCEHHEGMNGSSERRDVIRGKGNVSVENFGDTGGGGREGPAPEDETFAGGEGGG